MNKQSKQKCIHIINSMKQRRLLLTFLGILLGSTLLTETAEAANHYVRQGASGSGSDWTNAYATLPASLTRGDTYYVADGSYSSYTFDDDASGTSVITIKKATASDHGTDTGWTSTYGDGQAAFGEFQFTRPYYAIDGATRNESNWKDSAAYGIKTTGVRSSRLDGGHSPSGECSGDNLSFRYMHVGTNTTSYSTFSGGRSFYIGGFGGGSMACQNWTISKVLIQNTEEIQCAGGDGITVEDSYIYTVWAKEAMRGQIYCSNVVFRRNTLENACLTKPGTTDRCTAELAAWDGTSMDHWEVYGNTIWRYGSDIENSNGVILIGDNGWGGNIGPVTNNSVAYNNTIAGIIVAASDNYVQLNGGSGNVARNNLGYNSDTTVGFGANTVSNNMYATSNPFVNYSSGNFRLTAPTASGYTLSSPYNTDPDGNVRGADGVWDIGAYEYGGTSTPDTTPPTSPTNLVANATSQSSITVSWTAATDNIGVVRYDIERCQGLSCSNFAQVGTTQTSPFTDTGLSAATGYSYHVKAVDAAGNSSGWSNVVGATTQAPDTTPPTIPTNFSATAASSSIINLTWTASTDSVGVTGYKVERCSGSSCTTFTQVGTPTTNSYQDTNLSASTLYRYRVRAIDAAGNNSSYSSIAEATTQTPPPVSDSLMLGLSFNEGSGTTTQDVSGHDNTGTLQNGTAWNTTGKYSNSLTFDGVDDVVDIGNPSTLNLTSSFTLSAWIYPTNLSGDRDIITKVNGSSDYHLQITGNAVQVGFSNGGWYSATTTNTVPLNTWTHVAGVFNDASNTLTVYIGGTQSAQTTNVTATPQSTSNPVHVGMGWSGQNWNGRIDDVRIYNTALSQSEIQTDMNTPLSTGGSSPTPTACSLLTTPTLWNSDPNHASFGTPYDLFDSNNLTVKADCTSGSPTTMNLSIGKVNDSQLFSLMQGYYWNGTDWTSYTLNTCSGNQTGSWCQGTSSGTITNANINTGDQLNPQYFLGLTCRYTGSLPWKCGCQDSSCATPSWQLQGAGL